MKWDINNEKNYMRSNNIQQNKINRDQIVLCNYRIDQVRKQKIKYILKGEIR